MRYKTLILAVAALLALGAGGVTATTMTTPAADAGSAGALPANYTVDIANPDEITDQAAEQAIETAWADDDVRNYVEGDAVHFEVWASELDDETVYIDVAPLESPAETLVRAHVDVDEQIVTSTDEPVTLNASNAISITASDEGDVSVKGTTYELNQNTQNTAATGSSYTAEKSTDFHINASTAGSETGETFFVTMDNSEGDN